MRVFGTSIILAGLVFGFGPRSRGETLADAVELAYGTNPTLQGQRASQRALDETIVQAQAGYRPTVTFQGSVGTDTNNYRLAPAVPGQTSAVSGRSQTSNAVLTLIQPIFTGGRVSSEVDAARASVLAGQMQLRATEESVLEAVIGSYVGVLRDQESVAVAKESVQLLQRELREAGERSRAGEITRTDVAQTEGRVAAAQAQLFELEAQLADSRASYLSTVGQSPGALASPPPLDRLLTNDLDEAVQVAERNSPLLMQSRALERASASHVASAKAQRRPSLSLQANLGYYGGNYGLNSPLANYDHDASALAVLTVPLFTGGLTSSQIRQAVETNNADEIAIEQTRRQVVLNVTRAWNALVGGRARLIAQTEQVRTAKVAFEGSRLEAAAGLRSNLDVLISEQDLQASRIALSIARGDVYIAETSLLAAEGRLNLMDLAPQSTPYDARRNTEHLQRVSGAVPWEPVIAGLDRLGAPPVAASAKR